MRKVLSLAVISLISSAALAQQPVSQTFPHGQGRVWAAALGVLEKQGWRVERADKAIGVITTVSSHASGAGSASFQPSSRTAAYEQEYERLRGKKAHAVFWNRKEQSQIQEAYVSWQDSLQADQSAYNARLQSQAVAQGSALPIGLSLLVLPTGQSTAVTISVSVTSSLSEFVTCSSNGRLESRIFNDLVASLATQP